MRKVTKGAAGAACLILVGLVACGKPPSPVSDKATAATAQPRETLSVGLLRGVYPIIDNQNVSPGDGYNRFTGETMKSPFANTASTTGKYGQDRQYRMLSVRDFEEIKRSLSASASGSGNYYGFEFSGDTSYRHELETTKLSKTVIIRVQVLNWPASIAPGSLTPKAADQLSNRPDEFYQEYGTEFVAEVATGGTYFQVRSYQARSERELRQLDAALEASYGDYGGDAEFHSKLETLHEFEREQITLRPSGGDSPTAEETASVDGFFRFASRFSDSVKAGSGKERPVALRTRSYKSVLPAFNEVPLRRAAQANDALIKQRSELTQARAVYAEARTQPTLYCRSDASAAPRRERAAKLALEEIHARIETLAAAPYESPLPSLVDTSGALPAPPIRPDVPTALDIRFRTSYDPNAPKGTWTEQQTISPGGPHTENDKPWFGDGRAIGGLNVRFAQQTEALQIRTQARILYLGHTGWTEEGETVGKPSFEPVLSVHFKLIGPLSGSYDVMCQAEKLGVGKTIVVKNDAWCGPETGGNFLAKLAIWVEPREGVGSCAGRDSTID